MKTDKLKSSYIGSNSRLDGKFYLNDDAVFSRQLELNQEKCTFLEDVASVWNPPIFKRQFCLQTERAVQYCQSSDVTNVEEGSSVYINRKQAEKVGSIVKKNQILITGFGTIGNTRLVNTLSNGISYANNVCRVEANSNIANGFLYAFLSSKYGKAQLNKNASGSVVRYIEAPGIKKTLVPLFPEEFQEKIHNLIIEVSELRVEANRLLQKATYFIHQQLDIEEVSNEFYEYFGSHSEDRKVGIFKKRSRKVGAISINAFNHSQRIESLRKRISSKVDTWALKEILVNNTTFSTGSFPRKELNSPKAVELINQKDIFNTQIKGKMISPRGVKDSFLVEYGEVIIAGVGTLGEGETFCRTIFGNEDLEGKLISGEFIRMNTTDDCPSGYLYAWLASDFGFRFLRSIQSGTKLCRPIPELLRNMIVPKLEDTIMAKIDDVVKKAYSMKFHANKLENQAIAIVEQEIESWQNNKQ